MRKTDSIKWHCYKSRQPCAGKRWLFERRSPQSEQILAYIQSIEDGSPEPIGYEWACLFFDATGREKKLKDAKRAAEDAVIEADPRLGNKIVETRREKATTRPRRQP